MASNDTNINAQAPVGVQALAVSDFTQQSTAMAQPTAATTASALLEHGTQHQPFRLGEFQRSIGAAAEPTRPMGYLPGWARAGTSIGLLPLVPLSSLVRRHTVTDEEQPSAIAEETSLGTINTLALIEDDVPKVQGEIAAAAATEEEAAPAAAEESAAPAAKKASLTQRFEKFAVEAELNGFVTLDNVQETLKTLPHSFDDGEICTMLTDEGNCEEFLEKYAQVAGVSNSDLYQLRTELIALVGAFAKYIAANPEEEVVEESAPATDEVAAVIPERTHTIKPDGTETHLGEAAVETAAATEEETKPVDEHHAEFHREAMVVVQPALLLSHPKAVGERPIFFTGACLWIAAVIIALIGTFAGYQLLALPPQRSSYARTDPGALQLFRPTCPAESNISSLYDRAQHHASLPPGKIWTWTKVQEVVTHSPPIADCVRLPQATIRGIRHVLETTAQRVKSLLGDLYKRSSCFHASRPSNRTLPPS